jgi:outer membrane protein assembly factor BamB
MKRILYYVLIMVLNPVSAQEWSDWRGTNRDGIWKEDGIVNEFRQNPIALKWRVNVGPGYSGPTVSGGKVYLTDKPESESGQERVLCFNAETGAEIWSYSYDCNYETVGYPAGPRASVVLSGGKAYSLGTMGNLFCFNAMNGKVLWKKDLKSEYAIRMPIWGIAATPLVRGQKIFLQIGGSDNACLIALDKNTGKEIWRSLEDKASYSAPVMINREGRNVLVAWTADNLAGLDPESGKVHWKIPFAVKMGMGISTPVIYDDFIFVSCFYSGSLLVKIDSKALTARKIWLRAGENEIKTDALHCVINTPVIKDGFIYGVDSYGQLRCLELKSGNRVWENGTAVKKDRWANIHFINHGDKIWMFNEHGELLITELTPEAFTEISRAKLIEPTTDQLNRKGTGVTWSHPAFAGKYVFARNDKELVCAYLGKY